MYLKLGANSAEEVDLVEKGKNYGWPRMEGKHCVPRSVNNCKKSDLTLPIASFPRIVSSSVTGGMFIEALLLLGYKENMFLRIICEGFLVCL